MALTQLKEYIFDENYQQIIYSNLDTKSKLSLKQVCKNTCNSVEFNNIDSEFCQDIIDCNNYIFEKDFELLASEEPEDVAYLDYIEDETNRIELFIKKQKNKQNQTSFTS